MRSGKDLVELAQIAAGEQLDEMRAAHELSEITLSSHDGGNITIRRVETIDTEEEMDNEEHDDSNRNQRMTIEEQIALLQSGSDIQIERGGCVQVSGEQDDDMMEHDRNDISDHVISIEEDG